MGLGEVKMISYRKMFDNCKLPIFYCNGNFVFVSEQVGFAAFSTSSHVNIL